MTDTLTEHDRQFVTNTNKGTRERPKRYFLPEEVVVEELQNTEGMEKLTLTRDEVAPFKLVRGNQADSEDFVSLVIGDRELVLDKSAYAYASRGVGLSEAYIDKTPPELVVPHLNFWYTSGEFEGIPELKQSAEDRRHGPFGVLVKDDRVVAFTKAGFQPISNMMLYELLQKEFGDVKVDKVHASLDYMTLSCFTEEGPVEVTKGDILFSGVTIQNSPTGAQPITVEAYLYRLVCLNGAISPETVYRWSKRGDTTDLPMIFAEKIHSANLMGHDYAQRLAQLRETTLNGDVQHILEGIYTQSGMPGNIQHEINARVSRDQPENLYELVNSITWVASNNRILLDDPVRMRRLMRVGGEIIREPSLCPTCHRPGMNAHLN